MIKAQKPRKQKKIQRPLENQRDPWGAKEFVWLILLEFVVVVIGVKHGLQPLYERWLNNPLYAGTLIGFTISVILTAGVFFIALRPRKLGWEQVGIVRQPAGTWPKIAGWTGALIVLSILTVVVTSMLGNPVDNAKTESLRENVNVFTLLIGLLSAAFISPLYEEIFYRGFMYRWLRSRTGVAAATVISSLIFTAAHFPTLNAMPVNFISGMIFARAYERTGSVIPGIIVHGLFNALAVLLSALG